jgi:hypothetical protein
MSTSLIQVRAQPVTDANPFPVTSGAWSPNAAADDEAGTVTSSDVLLTSLFTLDDATQWVMVGIEDAAIRMTMSGTAASATIGTNWAAGVKLVLSREEAEAARVYRATGTDAKLTFSQYLA